MAGERETKQSDYPDAAILWMKLQLTKINYYGSLEGNRPDFYHLVENRENREMFSKTLHKIDQLFIYNFYYRPGNKSFANALKSKELWNIEKIKTLFEGISHQLRYEQDEKTKNTLRETQGKLRTQLGMKEGEGYDISKNNPYDIYTTTKLIPGWSNQIFAGIADEKSGEDNARALINQFQEFVKKLPENNQHYDFLKNLTAQTLELLNDKNSKDFYSPQEAVRDLFTALTEVYAKTNSFFNRERLIKGFVKNLNPDVAPTLTDKKATESTPLLGRKRSDS